MHFKDANRASVPQLRLVQSYHTQGMNALQHYMGHSLHAAIHIPSHMSVGPFIGFRTEGLLPTPHFSLQLYMALRKASISSVRKLTGALPTLSNPTSIASTHNSSTNFASPRANFRASTPSEDKSEPRKSILSK